MAVGAEGSEDWRAGFQRVMLEWLVRHGEPIDERASRYSRYHHPDWLGLGAHLNTPGYIREARHLLASQRAVVADWTAGTGVRKDGMEGLRVDGVRGDVRRG